MPAQRFCDLDLSFRKLWVPDPLRHESVPRTQLPPKEWVYENLNSHIHP